MKRSMLDQTDKEGLLLLYIADELSPADRLAVERMLQTDAPLKREYDALVSANAMLAADAASLEIDQTRLDRAIAKTQQAMHDLKPAPSVSSAEEPRRLMLPWWTYPVAAAASILVAAAVFMANISPPPIPARVVSQPSPVQTPTETPMYITGETYALAEDLAASFDESDHVLYSASSRRLLSAARELDALRESSSQLDTLQ